MFRIFQDSWNIPEDTGPFRIPGRSWNFRIPQDWFRIPGRPWNFRILQDSWNFRILQDSFRIPGRSWNFRILQDSWNFRILQDCFSGTLTISRDTICFYDRPIYGEICWKLKMLKFLQEIFEESYSSEFCQILDRNSVLVLTLILWVPKMSILQEISKKDSFLSNPNNFQICIEIKMAKSEFFWLDSPTKLCISTKNGAIRHFC